MKFLSLTALADYLIKENLTLGDFNVEPCEGDIAEIVETVAEDDCILIETVNILSLSDKPEIEVTIADIPMNELHVSKFDVLKDACGAGNITLKESTIMLNTCDTDEQTTTHMSLSINGMKFPDVPLSLKESTTEKIILSKSWVSKNLN